MSHPIPEDLQKRYKKCCDPDEQEYSAWECTLIERIAALEAELREAKQENEHRRDEFDDYKMRLWSDLGSPEGVEFITYAKQLREQVERLSAPVTAGDTNATGMLGDVVPASYSAVCTAVIAARLKESK